MASLSALFRDLLHLRQYRAAHRRTGIPWWMRIAYFRNVIRHRALNEWRGGYVYGTDGRLVAVPSHVDTAAGHRLLKPSIRFNLVDTICREGDCVFDIGANIGDYTLQMAQRVGPTGRVVAFEPVPYLADTIRKTARINRHDWVEVLSLAVSASEGRSAFSVERGNSGGSRLGKKDGDFYQIEVETIRLDGFMSRHPEIDRLDVLKIDVEGFEDQVIVGAADTLGRFRPAIIVETGFETTLQRQTICDHLSRLGYEIVGVEVPGGLAEFTWADYREGSTTLRAIGVSNMLLMHSAEGGQS